MIKPDSLLDTLSKSVDFIRQNPDKMHIFIKNGRIVSTLGPSLSFEYQYTLNLLVTDYSGDTNLLVVPILFWLRKNQPDMLTHDSDGVLFESDILNRQQSDIDISLKLTERVIVEMDGNQMNIRDIPEPPPLVPDEWAMS